MPRPARRLSKPPRTTASKQPPERSAGNARVVLGSTIRLHLNGLLELEPIAGVEPAVFCLRGRCFVRLSYIGFRLLACLPLGRKEGLWSLQLATCKLQPISSSRGEIRTLNFQFVGLVRFQLRHPTTHWFRTSSVRESNPPCRFGRPESFLLDQRSRRGSD